jgi:hypothetical protein
MAEKPLSEVADFLKMFGFRNGTVSLTADKKAIKEIMLDLALEMS